MMFMGKITVYSQQQKGPTNELCRRNVVLFNVKKVHMVTTASYKVKPLHGHVVMQQAFLGEWVNLTIIRTRGFYTTYRSETITTTNSLTVQDCTITILDIVHRPVFYLKHEVSETGFCLRLPEEPTNLGPIVTASLCMLTASQTDTSSIYLAQLSRFHLKTETESSLRNVVF
jgi:hypothetical protein